jgi:tetratricopeptide (TPR) repeat protein
MMTTCQIKKTNAIGSIIVLMIVLMAALAGCGGSKKITPREDDVHGARAYHHFLNGDMPRAIEVYKRGFAAARKIDNVTGATRYLSNIGRAYYELGQLDSAALYLAKAYEDFILYGNKNEASKSAAFLALCFATAVDDALAKKWWNTATSSVNTANKKNKGQEHYYAVIKGIIDFKLTSKVSDENAIHTALAFYKKGKNHSALSTTYTLLADIELSKGNCAAASQYLKGVQTSIDKSGEKYKRSRALLTLAKISFCSNDEKFGRHYYERAIDCAPKGVLIPLVDEISSCVDFSCRK